MKKQKVQSVCGVVSLARIDNRSLFDLKMLNLIDSV